MKQSLAHRSFIIVTLVTAMLACSESNAPAKLETGSLMKSIQIKHSNGLILDLPDGAFYIMESATGFFISPPDAESVRNPFQIEIALRPGPPPEGNWPKTRDMEAATAHYRIEVAEGGSGGEDYTLTAWIPCLAGYIIVRQTQQAEMPKKPDLSPAWTVLDAAHCENPTPRN